MDSNMRNQNGHECNMENPLGELEPPNHIEPHIKESDLKDLANRDQKTLFALSVLDQRVVWCVETIIKQNTILGIELGKLQSELHSLRTQQNLLTESNRTQTWQWLLIKWTTLVTLGGVLAAIAKKWIDKTWP